jgi:hypothetical protein
MATTTKKINNNFKKKYFFFASASAQMQSIRADSRLRPLGGGEGMGGGRTGGEKRVRPGGRECFTSR